jgi:hypothetical protein
MSSRSFKDDFIATQAINQKPVWFDMAFPTAFEIADKFMIAVLMV